jgi:hypothetical protein
MQPHNTPWVQKTYGGGGGGGGRGGHEGGIGGFGGQNADGGTSKVQTVLTTSWMTS